MDKYEPSKIEPKWLKKWEEEGFYRAYDFDKRPKRYILIEFPYPSGERLHCGHGRSYTALDALSRKLRMQGFNVLYPIGWDAFGLPAENYAIKMGVNPSITTARNIANAKAQVKSWGLSFDWSREINTTDPKYYKWTQWIFLKLLEKGLAYQAEVPVNWCPFCKTNLADEEVLADGKHERCGHQTERRMQKQWILKITEYANRLLEDLDKVDYLPKIRIQQENWIGRSEGAEVRFKILASSSTSRSRQDSGFKNSGKDTSDGEVNEVSVFTTRPDTLYGATFMVIAPEHKVVAALLNSKLEEVEEYVERAKKKSDLERIAAVGEKTGVFSGLYAINPVTGKEIPIWISDFVLSGYGTGAIMAVPAHDERDWAFAKKFNLPIVPVIKPEEDWDFDKGAYTDVENGTMINSPLWNGKKPSEAIKIATQWVVENKLGKKSVNYHLRDWVFSRQHYWGEPIPVIHCPKCGVVPVPENQLPVELPYVEKYQPTGTGESPLASMSDWVNAACPECGGPARRETDTMPNWAGSNWYFVRYCDPQNDEKIADSEKLKYWMPVDLYNGGMEHTTLHLLYSRFIYKFLFDIGVVPACEPYARRTSHGVVLGPDGQKMSKSLGNVVNPDDIVNKQGADTFRVYESFMGPFDQMIAWNNEGIEGCFRFLNKVWRLSLTKSKAKKTPENLARMLSKTVKKVGDDLESMKFNTAVAAMMEFANNWQDDGVGLDKEDTKKFLLILSPFAPFITEELYQEMIGRDQFISIHQQSWPVYDPKLIEEETVTIIVQINGKVRGKIEVERAKSKDQSEIEKLAKEEEKVKVALGDKKIKRVVFVPGKLVNFVV